MIPLKRFFAIVLSVSVFLVPDSGLGQSTDVAPDVASDVASASERAPSAKLRVTDVLSARFPVVDVHTHFYVKAKHDPELLERYVEWMDRNNIAVSVSLDAQLSQRLDSHEEYLWRKYRDRFVLFANIDFQGSGKPDEPSTWACNQDGFVPDVVARLRVEHQRGRISGLKFFKDFGLRWKNRDGSKIRIDDPRWDPIWEVCGRLQLPILMHTADPSAFFRPIDSHNERETELRAHPDWSFFGEEFPSRSELHAARNRVIARFPGTIFIAAHLGNDGEDLQQLAGWLDEYPNLMVEMSSRINELGRQPYRSNEFIEKYSDRVFFGTDGPFPEERLRIYWRFLETRDEYFLYSEKSPPPQGDWRIYGLGLSPGTLEKVYSGNAIRVIPGVAARLEKYRARSNP